jgi:hypothetical protein
LNTGGTNRGHLSNKKSGAHRQKWGHSSISSTEIRDFTQQKSDFPSEKWDLLHRCAETAIQWVARNRETAEWVAPLWDVPTREVDLNPHRNGSTEIDAGKNMTQDGRFSSFLRG